MGKHLTLDQRITIQVELERNTPIKAIARMIGKAPRTVAREIKQRRVAREAKPYGRTNNRCVRRDRCSDWARCPGEGRCPRFEQERCERVHGSPFVCNGCPKLRSCALTRYLYSARRSDASYRTTLRERREGVNIGPDELKWLDGIVSPGVIKGQSIHHAVWQQRERLPVCERTIYRYFRAGNLFTARRGDLRRACRLKPRKGKRKEHKLDTRCREGRTYELYRRHLELRRAEAVRRGPGPLAREQLRAAGPGQPPPRRPLREALRQGRGEAGNRPRGAARSRAAAEPAGQAGETGDGPGRRCPIES